MKKKLIRLIIVAMLPVLVCPAYAAESEKKNEDIAASKPAVYVDGVAVPEVLVAPKLVTGNIMYGTLSDEEKQEKQEQLRTEAIETLIYEQACINEAERNGITLTGEIVADADRRYQNMIASVEAYVKKSYPDITESELTETVDSLLKSTGASRAVYHLIAERTALLEAFDAWLLSEMAPPAEEKIRERYETLYSEQKALFDENENAFEAAMLNGELVLYRPVPLKLIRKAEFKFEDMAIGIIRSTRMYNAELADEMTEDQYRLLDETFKPTYADLLSGEKSFTEVLETLEPGSSEKCNYFNPASTRFSADYYSRADAFTTPGEISTCYRIVNGYAVLEYFGDLDAEERIPFENVREALAEGMMAETKEHYLAERKVAVYAKAEVSYPEGGE